MPSIFRLSRAAVLAAALATPLAAQEVDPQPGFLDYFGSNRIGTFLANTAIAALRTQMELEYQHLSTDIMRGTVSISGVVARPQLPYDQARQCVVTVDRAVLQSDLSKPFSVASEAVLNLVGASISSACVPRDVAMALRGAGINALELDQAKLSVAYLYATGETSADLSLVANGIAALDATASGIILPRMDNFGAGDPALRVTRALVSLKDQGGWAKISTLLPPNFRDPATISAIGTEELTQAMSDNGQRNVTAVERNFIADLMARVEDFVATGGEITIEANVPPTGITVEPEVYRDEPQALVTALALEARSAPLARSRILSTTELAALRDPDSATPARRLELGAALLEGRGVPQAPALVPDLLEPLVADPATAPQAAALIARALQDTDAALAYRYALAAAAGDATGAIATLDRLEARMTTQQVLAAQADNIAALTTAAGDQLLQEADDPRQLRAQALRHLTGSGAARSYARAYYFALLAEAAGDVGATSLRQEIEARFGARGPAVQQVWAALSRDLQAQALDTWLTQGLAERFKTD